MEATRLKDMNTHEQVASLAHSVNTQVQRLDVVIGSGAVGGTQMTASPNSYACDPEPDGDLNNCQGLILQCLLVFSQRARLFPTEPSKINYVIGLLRGRALARAQASAGTRLGDSSLDAFLAWFERIFDHPNYARETDFSPYVKGCGRWWITLWNLVLSPRRTVGMSQRYYALSVAG